MSTRTPRIPDTDTATRAPRGPRGRGRTIALASPTHRLPEGPDGWRLDDHAAAVARAGLAQAREALRLARIAVAEREQALASGTTAPTGIVEHAAAA